MYDREFWRSSTVKRMAAVAVGGDDEAREGSRKTSLSGYRVLKDFEKRES
jgi:hypothetical protein